MQYGQQKKRRPHCLNQQRRRHRKRALQKSFAEYLIYEIKRKLKNHLSQWLPWCMLHQGMVQY